MGDDEQPDNQCFFREWVGNTVGDELPSKSGAPLRVLSMNILADGLTEGDGPAGIVTRWQPECFASNEKVAGIAVLDGDVARDASTRMKFRCPGELLDWRRRWPMLRNIILEHAPDIVGLQEVDLKANGPNANSAAHDEEIRRDLGEAGYDGSFTCKRGFACDGVAVFWSRTRLQAGGAAKPLDLGGVFVAHAQPLILDEAWRFVAVATHLKAGLTADAEGKRVQQARSLMQQLSFFKDVLILADLNSNCCSWIDDTGTMVQPQVYPLLASRFRSAYQSVLGEEPGFTSWGGWAGRDVRGVFDYILFKGNLLSAQRILSIPSAQHVMAIPNRLPNPEYPSDHFALAVDFLVGDGESSTGSGQPEAKRLRADGIEEVLLR